MFSFRRLLSLCALCFASACLLLALKTARAQTAPSNHAEVANAEDLVGATVVTTNGDSLRGQVKWKPDTPTPDAIRFRSTSAESARTYSPSALQTVRLDDGRKLVSRSVMVDQVPTDPRKATAFLQSGRNRERPDTLFLEVLVTGPLAMYAKLGSRNHYYVESEGDIAELRRRQQYVSAQNAVATRRRYRRQLRKRMKACPEAQAEAAHLPFQLQPMKNLVARYNRCMGETEVFERADRPRFSTSFGIVGGMMRSEFALSSVLTYFNSFGWGTGARLGASMTTRFLRANRHWAVRTELAGMLQRIEANAGRPGNFLGVSTLSRSDFVEMAWVKSAILMRYRLSTTTWSPYAEAGVTVGYLLSIDSKMPKEYAALDGYILDQNRITPGVAIGTGLKYRNVQVGVRGELTSAWASYSNFKSRLVNVSLSLGYQF